MSSKLGNCFNNLQHRVIFRDEFSDEDEASLTFSEPDSMDSDDNETANNLEEDILRSEQEEQAASTKILSSISFGALAKAQSSLRPFSLGESGNIKDNSHVENNPQNVRNTMPEKKIHHNFHRLNSHAPSEMSSKKAVSRRRDVVQIVKRQARDPRFEACRGAIPSKQSTDAYAFLDEYRNKEILELQAAIPKTRDPDSKEKLQKALSSMESRKKAQIRKQKEREILDRHRKNEKAMVMQGKKPFYLKKAEQRRQLLLDQFNELKEKEIDRVIERRRKKVEGKQKKKMPISRRIHE